MVGSYASWCHQLGEADGFNQPGPGMARGLNDAGSTSPGVVATTGGLIDWKWVDHSVLSVPFYSLVQAYVPSETSASMHSGTN